MSLIHCIYASAANHALDDAARRELLRVARSNNERLGITGMLLYVDDSFFQILEGEAEVVDELFLHIAGDPRHSNVTEIIREPVVRRAFPDWSMGYAAVSRADILATTGLNDFFGDASCLRDIDAGRAKKLLHAFACGRWRQPPATSSRQLRSA